MLPFNQPPAVEPDPFRIALVYRDSGEALDAIGEYTSRLRDALAKCTGIEATVELLARDERGFGARLDRAHAVVLQYQPFSYGRWGFAPWLVHALGRARFGSKRRCVALMVHEPYVPMHGWRWSLMGAWQRVQLAALQRCAHMVWTTTDRWAGTLSRRGQPPVAHFPVGSNLPAPTSDRQVTRQRLGASRDDLVVALFGRDHPTLLPRYSERALQALTTAGHRVRVVNLGMGAPAIRASGAAQIFSPGALSGEEAANLLSAADLFLAPWSDGASTRRTTLMAALDLGLPVVSTRGSMTDQVLLHASNSMVLAPVGDIDAFATAAVQLAADPRRRNALGRSGRTLYTSHFGWARLAERVIEQLTDYERGRA